MKYFSKNEKQKYDKSYENHMIITYCDKIA